MSRVAHHQPAYPDLHGQFRRSYHLELVADDARVGSILRALEETVHPDDVFCEIGCGSGVFAIEAAKRCRKVFAIELDPETADLAEANIQSSGQADRIRVLRGDACEVSLPERSDVALCEMMSIWAVEEPLVPVTRRVVRDLLKPDGILLPLRVVNLVELGWYPYRVLEVAVPAVVPLFTGMPRAHVMTESRVCRVLDLSEPTSLDLGGQVLVESLVGGRLNCAVLRSVVQMSPSVVFAGSDSLMPPTVVPLERPLEVRAGQRIRFRAEVRARSTLESGRFTAELQDS